MHTAYNLTLPKNLSFVIESMTAFGDNLIVGTKQGHLLMFKNTTGIDAGSNGTHGNGGGGNPSEIRLQLLKTNKTFRKPIVQLEVVPELSILVALSDGCISVHDIDLATGTNFPIITTVVKSGCSSFAIDVLKQRSLTGEIAITLRLVAALKRKLSLFYWKNRKFNEYRADINLLDTPKVVAWCKESICLGFKTEYSIIKLSNSDASNGHVLHRKEPRVTTLFNTGNNQEPQITLTPDGERFSLARDDQTIFVDLSGEIKGSPMSWPNAGRNLVHDVPYVLSLQPNGVVIKSENPRVMVQMLNLTSKPRLICASQPSFNNHAFIGGGMVYVASSSHLWYFRKVSTSRQTEQLVGDKQFELAIALLISTGNESDAARIDEIKIRQAFDLFCGYKFKQALDILFDLNVDTSHVIGLYGDLLPRDFQGSLNYPSTLPTLEEDDLIVALRDLIEYLTKVRQRLKKPGAADVKAVPIIEGGNAVKLKRINEIVDTTLVKCYLRIEDRHSLLAPLLRLKDNQCHLKETESVLRKYQKFSELTIFYNTRGLHKRALELLKRHSADENSPLLGFKKTVQYLHNLQAEHIELICEYSVPVLEANPEEGLAIFIADTINVEEWPRDKVLDFLLRTKKSVVAEYLEFIIDSWEESNPLFHNALINQYKEAIVDLLRQNQIIDDLQDATGDVLHLSEDFTTVEADKSSSTFSTFGRISVNESATTSSEEKSAEKQLFISDKLSLTRKKLKDFLQTSKFYKADVVLPQFPTECMFEERAVLLGSLGRHLEALALILYKIKDSKEALKYCKKYCRQNDQENLTEGVYTLLYRLLVQFPQNIDAVKNFDWLSEEDMNGFQPSIETGLFVLDRHGIDVDILTVVDVTPDFVPLARMAPFLQVALQKRVSHQRMLKIKRSLMHAQHLQAHEERIRMESQKVIITESTVCQICNRRFRPNVAFVRLRSGEVIHYSCKEKAAVL